MGFYMVLHCDTPDCPHGGNEEGVQGTNRGSIKRDARAAGWLEVDGRWHCSGCAEDRWWKQPLKRRQGSKFAREIGKRVGKPVDVFKTVAGVIR